MAIKGHLMLSTKEIIEKVRKAEEETASKKTRSKTGSKAETLRRGQKRKRPETPSEDEEESSCDSDSSSSDCIVVGKS
ncbi:MAG: hypothetical protein M1813_000100 [Trichoglossum hirsutum]|nr:MAG: hypothetical protein M1813_000100 [Trichoglossum hirsutum]